MLFDWDTLDKEIEESALETDQHLISKISSLTRMKDDEIKLLFPKNEDQEKLIKLMQIVEKASKDNEKTVELVNNVNDLAGTIVKLLNRFV
ncbi:MAG: hypothetical protein ACE5FY_06995 [Nitrospiria bacterium]